MRIRSLSLLLSSLVLTFSLVLWALLSFPRPDATDARQGAPDLAQSYAGRIGHAMANDAPQFRDLQGWRNDHTDWQRPEVLRFRKRLAAPS